MAEHELMIGVRNILFAHLMMAVVAPEGPLRLRGQLVRMWKTLKTRLAVTRSNLGRNKFWEIDLTKLEP